MGKPVEHVKDLKRFKKNAREHNRENVGLIVESLRDVGPARSIVIDEDDTVLAGAGTVDAAQEAGITKLRVIDAEADTLVAVRVRGLSAKQKQRYSLADNRAADKAGYNRDQLLETDSDVLDGLFSSKELSVIPERCEAGEASQSVTHRAAD